jgi:hypothetical protein
LTRSTQNPFSGLWKVTRSTAPARTSAEDAPAALIGPLPSSESTLPCCHGSPVWRRSIAGPKTRTAPNELDRVKARSKVLAGKMVSDGCTEAKATAAVAMVGWLLERYALTMDEIEVREELRVQVGVQIGVRRSVD